MCEAVKEATDRTREGKTAVTSKEPELTNFEMPDVTKYSMGLAGFTMDIQRVWYWRQGEATRRRIGSRGMYKAGFARLPDGSLVATPCANVEKAVYVTSIYRSQDDGLTWQRVADGPLGKEPTLLALASGDLILLTEDLERRGNEFRIFRSTDGGRTWSECHMPGIGNVTTTRAIYQSASGEVHLFVSGGKWGAKTGRRTQAWIFKTADNGVTWSQAADVSTWDSPQPFFCEASVLPLSHDHLLLAVRVPGDFPSREGAPADMPDVLASDTFVDEAWNRMLMMESKDGGHTWSEPWPILERGDVHAHLVRLRDGRILVTYACYHLPWSVKAAFSEDGGKTFDTESPVLLSNSLWNAVGWATSIQLEDDSIITCYAKTAYWPDRSRSPGKSDHVCEVVRWELP